MRTDWTVLQIAHVTIEAKTAIAVGAAKGIGSEDAPVYLDASGLPQIPGTTLTGVLRSTFSVDVGPQSGDEAGPDTRPSRSRSEAPAEENLFGFVGSKDSRVSRVEISPAWIHGSDDAPAIEPELSAATGLASDPLLAWYQSTYRDQPSKRRRVRINERGVADDVNKGLFDRTVVPAGSRFTFEIVLWSNGVAPEWADLLDRLGDARFRLGAATRTGLGSVEVVRTHSWVFDLSKPEGFSSYSDAFARLQHLRTVEGGKVHGVTTAATSGARRRVFRLEPDDYWRIGGVEKALDNGTDPDWGDADLAPFTEPVVAWPHARGGRRKNVVETRILVPAAGIKGALRHRTAFHHARLTNQLIKVDDPQARLSDTDLNPAVTDLFGSIKGAAGGQRGRVIIDDVTITLSPDEAQLQTIQHNSINRFTGGVRNGYLFAEQMIWQGSFELHVTVLPGTGSEAKCAEHAFDMALKDLCEGRLAIGAASGRGHGRLIGREIQ